LPLLTVAVLLLGALAGCSGGRLKVQGGASAGEYTRLLVDLTALWSGETGLKFTEVMPQGNARSVFDDQQSGQCHVALCTDDYLVWSRFGNAAMGGTQRFSSAMLCGLYTNYIHILVRADSGINEIAQLADKKVALDASETASYFNADYILRAAGLPESKMYERMNIFDGVDALNDGKIDAVVGTARLGDRQIADAIADADNPLTLLSVPEAVFDKLCEADKTNYFNYGMVDTTYEGVGTLPMLGVKIVLVVPVKMKDGQVEKLLSGLFDNLDALNALAAESGSRAGEISLAAAVEGVQLADLHPAALAWYIKKGLLEEGQVALRPFLKS